MGSKEVTWLCSSCHKRNTSVPKTSFFGYKRFLCSECLSETLYPGSKFAKRALWVGFFAPLIIVLLGALALGEYNEYVTQHGNEGEQITLVMHLKASWLYLLISALSLYGVIRHHFIEKSINSLYLQGSNGTASRMPNDTPAVAVSKDVRQEETDKSPDELHVISETKGQSLNRYALISALSVFALLLFCLAVVTLFEKDLMRPIAI